MEAEAEQANVTAARLLIWNSNADILRRLSRVPPTQIAQQPDLAQLVMHVDALVHQASIIKVEIYDLEEHTLFSTDRSQFGEDEGDDDGGISARKGIVASEVAQARTIDAFEGAVPDRDMISSYLPIYGGDGGIVSVFEVYDDVTAFVTAINRFAYWRVEITVSVAILVNIVLVLIVGRGDRLLQHQHDRSLELMHTAQRSTPSSAFQSSSCAKPSVRSVIPAMGIMCAIPMMPVSICLPSLTIFSI